MDAGKKYWRLWQSSLKSLYLAVTDFHQNTPTFQHVLHKNANQNSVVSINNHLDQMEDKQAYWAQAKQMFDFKAAVVDIFYNTNVWAVGV